MALLGMLVKKKITEERFAQAFVGSLVSSVESGFSDVAGLINEDPDFDTQPQISESQDDEFLMLVLTGNIRLMGYYLDGDQEVRIHRAIMRKCGEIFSCDSDEFYKKYKEYCDFLSRVNHPDP